ncbi:MAG: hypothetical protein LBL66_10060 [Clostridiales bacterium]|jgi:AcrR family transcriptional regulator|nr:hypothetical protein [Clostridiales bacterium]
MSNSEDVKEKIALATIGCLERYGRSGTTIRRIAEIGGVNSAAISYHFGGADNLIDTVMRRTLGEAFTLSDYAEFENRDLKGYLRAVFTFLIEGARKFPNISKAHLYGIYTDGDYSSPVVAAMNGFLEQLLRKITPKTDLTETVLRRRLFILMSQVVYFIVSPGLLNGFAYPNGGGPDAEGFAAALIDDLFFNDK